MSTQIVTLKIAVNDNQISLSADIGRRNVSVKAIDDIAFALGRTVKEFSVQIASTYQQGGNTYDVYGKTINVAGTATDWQRKGDFIEATFKVSAGARLPNFEVGCAPQPFRSSRSRGGPNPLPTDPSGGNTGQ